MRPTRPGRHESHRRDYPRRAGGSARATERGCPATFPGGSSHARTTAVADGLMRDSLPARSGCAPLACSTGTSLPTSGARYVKRSRHQLTRRWQERWPCSATRSRDPRRDGTVERRICDAGGYFTPPVRFAYAKTQLVSHAPPYAHRRRTPGCTRRTCEVVCTLTAGPALDRDCGRGVSEAEVAEAIGCSCDRTPVSNARTERCGRLPEIDRSGPCRVVRQQRCRCELSPTQDAVELAGFARIPITS